MQTTPESEICAPQPIDDASQVLPEPVDQPEAMDDLTAVRALVPRLSALALGFLCLDPIQILATGGTHIHSR